MKKATNIIIVTSDMTCETYGYVHNEKKVNIDKIENYILLEGDFLNRDDRFEVVRLMKDEINDWIDSLGFEDFNVIRLQFRF